MDCCGNHPDYRHRSINSNHLTSSSGIGGVALGNSSGYFGHTYPSMKYQQSSHLSLYRFGGPGGYNGIGPPSIPAVAHAMYPGYDRYSGYPNISPYGINSNGYNYSNLSVRDLSGYYQQQYDTYNSRSVSHPYHAVHRGQYDTNGYGMRNSSNNIYHPYSYNNPQSNREYHHNSNNLYMHSSIHHNPHHIGASKDLFTPQIPNMTPSNTIENGRCDSVNDRNAYSSEVTSASSPHSNCSSNGGPTPNNHRLMHNDYSPHADSSSFMGNTDRSSTTTDMQQHNQTQQQHNYFEHHHQPQSRQQPQPASLEPQQQQQCATDSIEASKETKTRKTGRERERAAEWFGANRNLTSSIGLQSATRERCATPFVSSNNNFRNSPVNLPPRLQNGYLSSNQINQHTQQWSSQDSPKHRKSRLSSPRSQLSPMSANTPSKNKVLEYDFIPSKKSKKKIKSDSDDGGHESREEVKNITPLPGFQQAFGSTEIGRFSETFFNTIESPLDLPYESEADTLSPQPWEAGDSLEGPHYNLHIGASVQPVFSENHSSIDSPIDNNLFSEIPCSDY